MKKHNGMRLQDIVVLVKKYHYSKLIDVILGIANAILISPSEVSEALNTC